MKTRLRRENGLLSLEASIALTIFIFLMLFMYSFFVMFEARNEMAHVVLATTNSLALDPYENNALGDSGTVGQIFYNVYGQNTNADNSFTDYRAWYDNAPTGGSDVSGSDGGGFRATTEFQEVLKERFLAYLTGGNIDNAEAVLERYHIVGGVEGLDFTASHVSSGNLYVVVRYTLEYEFNVFGLGTVELEQSACSKIWK